MKIVNDSEIKDEKIILCGRLKKHFTDKDLELAINRIGIGSETEPHFHKKMTEIYLIVSGDGEMKIKEKRNGKN